MLPDEDMEEEAAEKEQSRKRQAESEKEKVSGCVSSVPTYKSEYHNFSYKWQANICTQLFGVNSNIANSPQKTSSRIVCMCPYTYLRERRGGLGEGGRKEGYAVLLVCLMLLG